MNAMLKSDAWGVCGCTLFAAGVGGILFYLIGLPAVAISLVLIVSGAAQTIAAMSMIEGDMRAGRRPPDEEFLKKSRLGNGTGAL